MDRLRSVKHLPRWIDALLVILLLPSGIRGEEGPRLVLPDVVLSGIPFDVRIAAPPDLASDSARYVLKLGPSPAGRSVGAAHPAREFQGVLSRDRPATVEGVTVSGGGEVDFALLVGDAVTEASRRVLPGWVSILPPLIAIVLAIAFRQVVLSLFLGIWVGTFFLDGLNPVTSFFRSIDDIIVDALVNRSHIEIILFSLMLGGMIGLISRNGGTAGIVSRISGVSTSALRGQVAAWAMGIFIFFDDYANTLIVGNTMRPITDRLRISREKLSYIVDATAAPVSSLAVISTWIGFEVGLIGDALGSLKIDFDPYILFLQTIPYRFYPILSLVFVFLVAVMGRDMGPMLKAKRAPWIRR